MKSKNLKKLIAVLLAAALLPAVAVFNVSADSTVVLFTEDFESYEVGTIIEAADNQTSPTRIGNIDYQLQAGDKLEIAQENGNKYLKITRGATNATNSHIKYYFPETYSGGKYFISYDFKPEVHNRYFARFGSLMRTSGINLTTISYGNNVYANSSTSNSAYYIGNLIKTANYTGSAYATITQEIDLTNSSNNYKFTAVYPGSSGTVTKTVTNTANQLGITGLAWAIQKNSNNNYNGPDDSSVAGVYRIDNIVVETTAGLELNSVNVVNNGNIYETTPFTMTFSESVSSASVSISKNGTAMNSSDYTVTVSGSTVSVIPVGGWEDGAEYTVSVGTVTAVSGCAPYEGGTYTVTGSDCLFKDDFEGYTVGTIAEAASDQSAVTKALNGLIGYQLKAGDKVEIAQEENGNKYLKLTRTSTSTSYSRYAYYFPQTYSGKKYTVSYDFMPEEHNQQFRHFGSLWKQNADGSQSGVIKQVLSWGKHIYYNNDPSKNGIPDILDTEKYTDSAYATISQTVDFTNLSSSMLKGVLPDGTVTEKTVGNSTAPQGVGFYGLLWDIQINSNENYNGSSDHTNPSVYRIDNIKVEAVPQKYVDAAVDDDGANVAEDEAVTLNFSEPIGATTDITVTKDGSALTEDTDYTVSVSGKTITVTPVNGWGTDARIAISGTVSATNTLTDFSGSMLSFYTGDAYVLSNAAVSGNTVTANLTNNTLKDKTCVAVAAQLDANGKIISVKIQSVTAESGAAGNISIEFSSSAPTYKLYIWDSLENMIPLTDKKTLSAL